MNLFHEHLANDKLRQLSREANQLARVAEARRAAQQPQTAKATSKRPPGAQPLQHSPR